VRETAQPHIASVALAVPPYRIDQAAAKAFMLTRYADVLDRRWTSVMNNVFAHSAIRRRYFAFDDPEVLINEPPDSRVSRFTHWSIELSAQALLSALAQAGVSVSDITGIVVNTCTGYICPGISTYLIERLGLSRRVRAYDLVGSGCGGAIPNLQVASALLKENNQGVVVSVSVEICSATFQMGGDLSLIVSNALFGDGAAAAVLWTRPEGLAMIESAAYYAPEHREDIRYVYKDGRLHNQLSTALPRYVKTAVAHIVENLLKAGRLTMDDIRHWAFHTGGEKIIHAIQEGLGLSEEQLRATRAVLADYGNMSSPTVWFVLRQIIEEGMEYGDWCIMAAFGAGLSAHGYLLRKANSKFQTSNSR
jgi:predicted naringenin-chalcone synthase